MSWGTTRRRRAILAGAVGALLGAGLMAPIAQADTTSTSTTTSTTSTGTVRVIMRFEPGVDGKAVVAAHGGTVVQVLTTMDALVADLPVGAIETLNDNLKVLEIAQDAKLQTVESEPEAVPSGTDVANGASNGMQFVASDHGKSDKGQSFDQLTTDNVAKIIDADDAHADGVTGAGIDVAVIDTGIAPVPGLRPDQVVNGPDLSFESQFPELLHLDTNGHGTHMAGVIAGVAPGSRLVNVRVGQADGAVDVSQVIAAIDWVVQHRNDNGLNIRVLNLAYGTQNTQSYTVDPLAYAAEVAWRNGIVVVAAAGNGGTAGGRLTNPAIDPYVVAVGASEAHGTYSTADDTVAEFSSRGDGTRGVDLVAPGRSVVSLRTPGSFTDVKHPEGIVDEQHFRGSGTSQAAAATSGAVALLLDEDPTLTPDKVKGLLKASAKKLPKATSGHGAGIINLDKARKHIQVIHSVKPEAYVQTWPAATGTGSLEGARGSSHVERDGVVLEGEKDIFGNDWDGASWSGASWSGSSWTGGDWMGASWSGSSWTGSSWTGASWSGASWSGASWSGSSWTGASWSGASWSGSSWTGSSWTGSSWTGASWSGSSWTGASWSGASWSGSSWTGASWSGASWSGSSWTSAS